MLLGPKAPLVLLFESFTKIVLWGIVLFLKIFENFDFSLFENFEKFSNFKIFFKYFFKIFIYSTFI